MKKSLCSILFLFLFQVCFSQQKLTEVEKLTTTCKVWGFLKYYHPNVAKGQSDWDEHLYEILSKVENIKTQGEFSNAIENWISSLGEVPKIEIIDRYPKDRYFYKNLDLSWTQNRLLFSESLSKKLKWIEENRFQGLQFYISRDVDKEGNSIVDDGEDEPKGIPRLQNERTSEGFTWKEKKYRLLTLFRYWNLIEYFAPNKYLIDKDWTTCLNDILPKISNPKDEVSYHYALLEMVANLNDSHASYYISAHNPQLKLSEKSYDFGLPFEVKIIDNYFVVSRILNKTLAIKNDIQVGDAISLLDGKTLNQYVEKYKNQIPASNVSYLLNQIAKYYLAFLNKEIKIEFLRGKEIKVKKIELYSRREHFNEAKRVSNEGKHEVLDGNIGYLNIGNIQNKDLDSIFLKIKDTKGIIVDVRNYPNETQGKLAEFLKAKPLEYAKQIHIDLNYPGRFVWEKPQFCGDENPDNYKGKIVVLVNEETISQAETLVMCLQTADDTVVIGSQTAGADGWNASAKIIYSHFVTTFTGKGFFYPDGTEMQRIGIVPNIQVKPTIEGIREGRDEVLERAIQYINE